MKTLKNLSAIKLMGTLTLSFLLLGSSLLSQTNSLFSEDYTEEAIAVEEWMNDYTTLTESYLDESYNEAPIAIQEWMVCTEGLCPLFAQDNSEETIALQDWMVASDLFEEETEKPQMALQDWMMSYETFAQNNDFELLNTEYEEPAIAIQDWMKDHTALCQGAFSTLPSITSISFNEASPNYLALHKVK